MMIANGACRTIPRNVVRTVESSCIHQVRGPNAGVTETSVAGTWTSIRNRPGHGPAPTSPALPLEGGRRAPETEERVGEPRESECRGRPEDPVCQQEPAQRNGTGVLLGDRPVPGHDLERGRAERIEHGHDGLVADLARQRLGNGPRDQEDDALGVDGEGAPRQPPDREEDGREDEDAGDTRTKYGAR